MYKLNIMIMLYEDRKRRKMNDVEKKKLKTYLCIGVPILIVIPLALDRFFAHELYMIWFGSLVKVESPMEVGEWFGFLGSYLGVVGTIIIGIIAYWQANTINQQSKYLNDLQVKIGEIQQEINDFQTHPIIRIKDIKIHAEYDSDMAITIQDNLKDCYYTIYGEEWTGDGKHFVLVTISFEDKGIIPTVQCVLNEFEWTIGGNIYSIKLNKSKSKVDTYNDEINILIEDNDILIDSKAFFQDIDLHEHNKNNGSAEHEKSNLALNITFINQKGKQQTYRVKCLTKSVDDGIQAGSVYFKNIEG